MVMTGSRRNASKAALLSGMAITDSTAGFVTAATTDSPAFAIATSNAAPGMTVQWSDDGTVTRKDWNAIAGVPQLQAGQTYYVGPGGRLATSGQQPIGTAINPTTLRISIGQVDTSSDYSRIIPVNGPPSPSSARDGDISFDVVNGSFYVKQGGQWQGPWKAPKSISSVPDAPIYLTGIVLVS